MRPAIERVGALSRLDLDILGDESDPLGLGEALDGGFLGFEQPAFQTRGRIGIEVAPNHFEAGMRGSTRSRSRRKI